MIRAFCVLCKNMKKTWDGLGSGFDHVFVVFRCPGTENCIFSGLGNYSVKGGGDGPVLGATFKRLSVLLFSCSWSATFLVFTFFDLRM